MNLTDIRISATRPEIAADYIARLGHCCPSRARVLCPATARRQTASPGRAASREDLVRYTSIALPSVVILGPELALVHSQESANARGDLGIRLDDPAAVRLVTEVFDSIWAAARPDTTNVDAADRLTDADTRLLRLLAAGLTYKVIARQLAISNRTVDRRVVQLVGRLGAGNRFDAVREATRLGLL
jgi:DNA-binding CsgD family transcriptional regulator